MRYFACPSGAWEIVVARPDRRLRQGVYTYRGFRFDVGRPGRWLGVPACAVTLLLGFDHERPLWFGETERMPVVRPFVSTIQGPASRSWVCEHHGSTYGVEVVLAPWAAFTLFGVEIHHLTGVIAEPDGRVRRLGEALAALPGWEARFGLLDSVFAAWLAGGFAWSPRVEWAYRQLARSGGTIPIRRLAEVTGWRPRQLEYRFREQVGLPPKVAARVFRFRNALGRLMAGWPPARTAAACGFSDQAHLNREFRAMTGLTPGHFRTRGAEPVADAVAVAESERLAEQVRSVALVV